MRALSLILLCFAALWLATGCATGDRPALSADHRCTLADRQRAKREAQIRNELLKFVEETRELEDGYALRFPSRMGDRLYRLVRAERVCCNFVRYELIFEPGGGPIWLHLRGDPETKRMIAEFIGVP